MSDQKARITPFLPNRVWRTYQGGAVLDQLQGEAKPTDGHLPEDWVGSTTVAINPVERPEGEGLARVDSAEKPLFRDLLSAAAEAYLGKEHVATYGADPRVLVKLLDSSIRLHFQAHPTAEFAREHKLGPSGKAEAYHILAIRPEVQEPYIYLGFQRPPSRDEFKRIIEEQDIAALEACFDRIPVRVGETYFIPGGRPHAIGPGILMVEVMEPSDLAVRFEFERGGYVLPESARFMGRGLDFCLDIFDYSPLSLEEATARYGCPRKLINTWGDAGKHYSLLERETNPRFSLRLSEFETAGEWVGPEAFIGIVTKGHGMIDDGVKQWSVGPYDRFFCPAALKAFKVLPADGESLTILESYSPSPEDCLPPF